MGLLERFVSLPPDMSSEYLRVAAGVTYLGSNAKARSELGYDPRSLQAGFEQVLPEEQRRISAAAA